ncbi:hypothetical protein DITRI_Ditri14bG0156500 [Diplodiscus trichospermus]
MLSIENPPSDPPCPRQFLQLKSGTDEFERPPHNLPLPEVDLLKQPSLDKHPNHHTPLPKFSIRDYVFTARSKDINKNWPFSPKNLQLCLKHGLKDPLPPFQSLDAVRNQSSVERCVVETNLTEKQNTRTFDEGPSGSTNHVVLESFDDAHSNHNLASTCIDNSSCRSGVARENDLPSATSVSQSDIDSVLVDKQSNLPLETDTSVEGSAEVQAAFAFKSQKTESTTRPYGKKCRLIVKFGAHSDRCPTEDIASNCTTLSESMASKVCPVCKTFSSSSNTTLNAHIDQCLSVESTPKWTVDSKLTRHRIKPRKTRLMVDVYATAKACTLEELDRRNGTSWATASSISRQEFERLEICEQGKKERVPSINPEDTSDVGAVYVDASGTKLRILSKFNDVPPVPKLGEDLGAHKSLKGGKTSKFFSTKKKRRHAQKHHKYLKLAPQSSKIFSRKTPSSTMVGGQEGYCGVEESCKSEGPHVPKQIKSSDSRNLKERMCSKPAGLSRKPNNQDTNQPLICKRHVTQDLRVQSDQSHRGDYLVERNCVRKFKSSSENPYSSENSERIEKPVYEAPVIEKKERSLGRKRARNPLFRARSCKKVERSFHLINQNANRLNKDHSNLDDDDDDDDDDDHMVRSLKSDGNCMASLSKKMVDTDADGNLYTPVTAAKTVSHQLFASKCFRFSSQKKNLLYASSKSSVVETRSNLVKKCSTRENQLHFMAEIDEAVAWGPEADQECNLVHDDAKNQCVTEELSFGGSSIPRAGEQRGRRSISGRKETYALKSIQLEPHCYCHDERENTDSSARGSEDILDKVEGLESVEKTVTSLSQSVETKFNKMSNISKKRSSSLQTNEDYSRSLCGGEGLADPDGPSLVVKPNMFCAEVGHGIIGQTANMAGGLDSEAAQGNFFPEVDPIPIPGPPGSFLPSPRDMGSDDFQGNSSLTTSRIQSSQDQLDLVDGDSSDSPISAVSTISNSVEPTSDLKYAEPLAFFGAPAAIENDRPGYTTARSDPLVENGSQVPQTSAGPERNFEGENFRVHRTSIEKRPFIYKNNNQPCCCQRKDRSSQDFALNYQESLLLRRRTMASMTVPAMQTENSANPNFSPSNLGARPETDSLTSSATLGSEQMVFPVMKPPAGPIPFKGCPDAGVKLSSDGGSNSASPSSSNPILRLMGKNLMVVNKEEDASAPLGQGQICAQSNCPTSNFPTSGISSSSIQNQGGLSFHHAMPQGSLMFDQNPNDLVGQSYDVRLTNAYNNCANIATVQTPVQFPAGMFLDEHMDGGFTSSMELYKSEGNYNLPPRPGRPKNKLGPAATYEMEKVATLDCQRRTEDSALSSKEVILIDDAPESGKTKKTADIAKHLEGLREIQIISSGISFPSIPNHSARHKNPFSHYQSEEDSLLGHPTVVQNNNFHAIPSRRANTSPVLWDCVSEGSGVLQQGPFMAVSPSTSHLRSAVYYAPSLS